MAAPRRYGSRVKSVRAAAVQDSPVLLDRAGTLDRVDELTDRAAEQGAQLVVFPEAFVPGPPVWIDALPVGDDAEWHGLLMRESVTVPGPACDRPPPRPHVAPVWCSWSASMSARLTAGQCSTRC